MAIEELWLATLTKNRSDAGGGGSSLDLTINIDGVDIVDEEVPFLETDGPLSGGFGPDDEDWLGKGQGAISGKILGGKVIGLPVATPFEQAQLNQSSVRVGLRSDDAWAPSDVLMFGTANAADEFKREFKALAMETEIETWLSTDSSEGKLTLPLRLVGSGAAGTLIHRVLLLVFTPGSGVDTDDAISLQIATETGIVLNRRIGDTPQDDLEPSMGNWYLLNAAVPFTPGTVRDGGGITLSIEGHDAWRPQCLFLFGLDTPEGRPANVVALSAVPDWNLGSLSTDPNEGSSVVTLPSALN